jgi:hypothetical protein
MNYLPTIEGWEEKGCRDGGDDPPCTLSVCLGAGPSLGTVGVAPAILDLSLSAQVLDDLLEEEIPIPGYSGRGSCHP